MPAHDPSADAAAIADTNQSHGQAFCNRPFGSLQPPGISAWVFEHVLRRRGGAFQAGDRGVGPREISPVSRAPTPNFAQRHLDQRQISRLFGQIEQDLFRKSSRACLGLAGQQQGFLNRVAKALARHRVERKSTVRPQPLLQRGIVAAQIEIVSSHRAYDPPRPVALARDREQGREKILAARIVGGLCPQLFELIDDEEKVRLVGTELAQRVPY